MKKINSLDILRNEVIKLIEDNKNKIGLDNIGEYYKKAYSGNKKILNKIIDEFKIINNNNNNPLDEGIDENVNEYFNKIKKIKAKNKKNLLEAHKNIAEQHNIDNPNKYAENKIKNIEKNENNQLLEHKEYVKQIKEKLKIPDNKELNTSCKILLFSAQINEDGKPLDKNKLMKGFKYILGETIDGDGNFINCYYKQINSLYVITVDNVKKYLNKRMYDFSDDFDIYYEILSFDKYFYDNTNNSRSYINLIIGLDNNKKIEDDKKILDKLDIEENLLEPDHFLKENNFNEDNNQAIISKFINYNINKNANTFGELFQRKYIPYVNENKKFNSCFINCIINDYKNAFDKINKNGKRKYKELTYDYLFKILDVDSNKEDNIGISINRAIEKFYSKFKLGLEIINDSGILIYKYPLDNTIKLNKNINPQIHRLQITNNNHIECINNKVDNFEKHNKLLDICNKDINVKKIYDEILDLDISPYYSLPKNKIEDDNKINKTIIFNEINELKNIIIELSNYNLNDLNKENECDCKLKNKILLKAIYTGDLDNLLYDIYFKEKISPKIIFSNSKIRLINLYFCNHFIITIGRVDIIQANDSQLYIDNLDTYEKYNKATEEYLSNLLTKDTLSDYHESILDINNYYKKTAIRGHFNNANLNKKYNAIDIRKCYTYILKNIKKIPKFDYFDIYINYDNHIIEELNEYIIEILDINNIISNLLCPEKYNRVYGIKLLELNKYNIKYNIIYYRRPSSIIDVNYNELIDKIYEQKFDENEDINNYIKKYIINVSTGLFEKKWNTKTNCHLFDNYKKANNYAKLFGGKVYNIFKTNLVSGINELDSGIECNNIEDHKSKKTLFIVSIENEKELLNGFKPIKDLIYDLSHIEIVTIYNKLINYDIKPLGVNTDCILYEYNPNVDIYKIFNFEDIIGGYKLEKFKTLCNSLITNYDNDLLDIFKNNNIEHKIIDEYNIDEFKSIYNNIKRLYIEGEYPGVGKTQSVKNIGKKTLFVLPYNLQCQENKIEGYDAITLNMLLGSGFDNSDYDNNKGYNIDGYEIICIDEIRLYSTQELKLIDRYMKKNSNIIFTSTGDSDQNVPFSYKPNNIKNMDLYIDNCIKIMFNNNINLKINKRLKTEEDKLKLYNLKKDILNNNIPLIDTFKKNNFNIINKYDEIKTLKNIVYFNKRAARIDKYIHENLIEIPKKYKEINGIKYWDGLDLICRSHLIIKKNKDENDNKKTRNKKIEDFIDNNGYTFKTNCRLYVNYRYTIDEIKDKFIVLKENVSKIKFLISYNQLSHFKLPYSFTGHSVQGLSIKEKITIFDTNTPYVDRKWVWTAITRARELDNINIFIHSDNEINNLNKSKIKQYFNLKINGYIQQDKKTNRYNPDNYIDFKWFKYNLFFINENNDGKNSYCPKCNIILDLDYDINNNITSNISADRIDNSKGHNKDNIKILCVDCNKKKSNKK